jgi:membrane protease YdiL (CAAX protease family)
VRRLPVALFLFFERTLVNTYLDLVHQGKNDWWRYVLAVLLILCMWQILGALPSVFLLVWTMISNNLPANAGAGDLLPGTDPLVSFVVLMLASVFFVLGVYLAVRFIHRRPFRTLITPARSMAWGRLLQGFGVWFVLAGLMSVLEAVLYPGRYVWTPDLRHFIPFVFLALILVPIQTSAEEFFFRGYILQGLGLRVRSIWALSVISGVLFMVPHFLNPEASVNYALMGLYYFSMGAFLAYITLCDGRLELALGVHAANNLFSALFANYTVTVMPSPSLFTVTVLDAVYSVPAALIGMVIFALLFIGPLRLKLAAENPGNYRVLRK